MVVDVGGEERAVAPAEDDLLAPVGGLPIHFHVQLVGLDQPGRLGQPFAHLRQEEHESVRPGAIARERRVGLRRLPALHGPAHQRQRAGRVPGLRERAGDAWRQAAATISRTDRTVAPRDLITAGGDVDDGNIPGAAGRGQAGSSSRARGVRRPRGRARRPGAEPGGRPRVVPLAAAIVLETVGPAAGRHLGRRSSPASRASSCCATARPRTSSSPS